MGGELFLARADFPEESEILAQLGVSQIRLAIESEGSFSVLRLVELAEAPPLPNSIIRSEALGN
jgi:hypothetical protein